MASLVLTSTKENFNDLPNIENGDWVINPKAGTLDVYTSSGYINILSDEAVTGDYVLLIFVNGQFQNFNINIKRFSIQNLINERIDTCSFEFRNNGDTDLQLDNESVIEVFDQEQNKIFGGVIKNWTVKQQVEGGKNLIYKITALSWETVLNKTLVANNYQNMLAGDIIKDIINNYAPFFSVNNVDDGFLIENITFNYKTVGDCIKKLAVIFGYNWYVDVNRDIHYFSNKKNEATTTIEDGGAFEKLKYKINTSQIRNFIILEGGQTVSFVDNDTQQADGERTKFNLAYNPFSPVRAFVDYGAGYIEKSVGIENINSTGFDFLVNSNEKLITNLVEPVLPNTAVLKVTYNKRIPVISFGEDVESQQTFKALGIGDGIFQFTIQDESIISYEMAEKRINAELIDNANPRVTGTFITRESTFKSGQLLTLNLVNYNISTQVLIQSIKLNPLSNIDGSGVGVIKYTVKFTTLIKGLQEFLLKLYNDINGFDDATDSIINTLFTITEDAIIMLDEDYNATLNSAGEYFWDNANSIWDEAAWT